MATMALTIPYETDAGEMVFARIEVWRLGAQLTDKPEVECLRFLPRFGAPEPISEEEYQTAVASSVNR